MLKRQRDRVDGARNDPDLRLWLRVGALVAVAAYLVAFVLENSGKHALHYVFGTRRVATTWLILLSVLIGFVAGILASQLNRRRHERRATKQQR